MKRRSNSSPIGKLPDSDPVTHAVNVVIETPRGSRNKYKFDEANGVFILHKVLPAGAVFPYDFGYVPGTLGEDGDPVDVLLLTDAPVFTGCVVQARLIGVIEAEQKEEGQAAVRNDRLVAVAVVAHDYRDLKTLKEMNQSLLEELEYFFISYNKIEGKEFRMIAARGPNQAKKLLAGGVKVAAGREKKKTTS